MTTVPSPALLAAKKRPAPQAPKRVTTQVIADIQPQDPGKVVRPGLVPEVVASEHDGVVKTKHLQPGQRVRPFVHGEARGGERVVASVEKVEDGAVWHVTFSSGHPENDFKAAYRWFDASLVGTEVQRIVKKPGFVTYQEV